MHRRAGRGFVAAIAGLLVTSGCGSVVEVEDPEGSSASAPPAGGSTGETPVDPTGSNPPPGETSTSEPQPDPETTTAAADEGSSGSCLFLGCYDDTDVPIECSLFEQNCPAGDKCMPWANDGGNSWNATRCTPIDPDPDGLYEPCTVEGSGVSGIDSCELGAMCWSVDTETLTGTCIGLCTGSPSAPTCADENAQCFISSDGFVTPCVPDCDPLESDACPPGEGCYPVDNAFTCAPDASGPKVGGVFDACEFTNACDPGLACINPDVVDACAPGAGGCCTPYCDLSAPACPAPTSCLPFFEQGNTPPGYEDVGICGAEGS